MEHVVSQVLITLTTQIMSLTFRLLRMSYPDAGKELALIRRHLKCYLESASYRERIGADDGLLALTLKDNIEDGFCPAGR